MASSSSRKQPLSAGASSSTAGSSSSAKGKGKMSTGDDLLDALVEVFPQLNFLTLVEVCMEYKNDIDGAADYIIHNVLPSILDDNDANANGASHMKGPASVDNDADSVQSDIANKYTAEEEEEEEEEGEEEDRLLEENSDCLVAIDLNSKPETSAFDDDLVTHDDGLPAMTIQSSYPVRLESLDKAIADEIDKKVTLMSNVTAINQMLEDIKLKEEKTKQAVLEATQAGNDIFVKVEELKEMTMLSTEENDKVAGEVFAEQSILVSEAHGLQARLSNISEERNNYALIIDEMRHTLQNRFAAAEVETVAAEKKKVERETLAEKMLNEQELILDATKERSKMLEQQVWENAKLRELLMDRGQVVDALQGEMLGIFDKISQLQLRVDKQLPEPLLSSMSYSVNSADNIAQIQCRVDDPQHSVDDSLQLAAPRLSSSFKATDSTAQAHCRVDEPRISVDESLLPGDECEQLHLVSPRLSSSVMSAQSQCRVDEPLLPVDEVLQLASSSSSSSLKSGDSIAQLLGVLDVHLPVDESLQLPSLSLSSSVKSSDNIAQFQQKADADELLQSSSLASSEKPATSKNWSSASDTIAQFQQRANADWSLPLPSSSLSSSENPATFKSSWSSAAESNSVFSGDEEIDDAYFHDNIDLDDSWDLVDDEAIYMCAN